MIKAGIDQDAIAKAFSEASAKQGEALRTRVSDATLKALQGRELTLDNVRKVLRAVTTAAASGAVKNAGSQMDIEAILGNAIAGMDAALLKAVEAHRKALQHFVDQGATLRERQLKGALTNLEKMEDAFFTTVTKAVESASNAPLQGPSAQSLGALKAKGSDAGSGATQAVKDLLTQTHTAMRASRASGANVAHAMSDTYAALAIGVLIGMSEGLQGTRTTWAPASNK